MLTGTADVETLAAALPAAVIPHFSSEPVELREVIVLGVVAELRRAGREQLLPPGLHPTDPPSLSIQAWRVGSSPWGPFSMCFTRLSCRSGVRARGFTTAALVDGDAARTALAERFGFPGRPAGVRIDRFYDRCDASVTVAGQTVLAIAGIDPEPLDVDDLQHTSTMNLAHTPQGLRLVQVEARHDAERVERVRGRISAFAGDAWGPAPLDPYHVVTTTVSVERSVTLPPVRFVCRPDVNAFEGTEPVAAPA